MIITFFLFVTLISYIAISYNQSSTVPKVIWTYWNGDIPPVIKHCIDTWRFHNPSHKIVILNDDMLPSYIVNARHAYDSPARRSDYIRLYVLQKHGGIWMDASIICHGPLPIDYTCDFSGYYLDWYTIKELRDTSPVIESWFLACKRNHPFVKQWYKEFMRTCDFKTINEYLENVRKAGTRFERIDMPDYLTIHVSAQKVLQDNPGIYKICVKKAEETAFRYLQDNGWDSEKAVTALINGSYNDEPLIKLRSAERKILEKDKFLS